MPGPDWVQCADDWMIVEGWDIAKRQAYLTDFTDHHHYQEFVENEDGLPIPNPQTRKEFANLQYNAFTTQSANAERWQTERETIVITELTFE